MSSTNEENIFFKFMKDVVERIITMQKIKKAIMVLYKQFLDWLAISNTITNLPPSSLADILGTFCERVNKIRDQLGHAHKAVSKNTSYQEMMTKGSSGDQSKVPISLQTSMEGHPMLMEDASESSEEDDKEEEDQEGEDKEEEVKEEEVKEEDGKEKKEIKEEEEKEFEEPSKDLKDTSDNQAPSKEEDSKDKTIVKKDSADSTEGSKEPSEDTSVGELKKMLEYVMMPKKEKTKKKGSLTRMAKGFRGWWS